MLILNEVNKAFDGFNLTNITMNLPKGYLMGLIGPNAAGKSTLIKTIMNVYQRDSGSITINGYDLESQEREAKNQVGFVLDENFFEESITARENARLYGQYYHSYHPEKFESYCRQFDIDAGKKLKKLSKGMQMKFQLAFALSHDAKLFLMDEPTASLDPTFRKELIQIITDVISDGEHSALLSTHLTDDLDRIADYIAFLNNGSLVFSKTKEELTSQYQLVTGLPYKIKLLPPDIVIWEEASPYQSRALIRKRRFDVIPDGLTLSRPNVEDIMYFMVKGGFHNVSINS